MRATIYSSAGGAVTEDEDDDRRHLVCVGKEIGLSAACLSRYRGFYKECEDRKRFLDNLMQRNPTLKKFIRDTETRIADAEGLYICCCQQTSV